MSFFLFLISTLSDKEKNRSLRAKSQLSADGIENFFLMLFYGINKQQLNKHKQGSKCSIRASTIGYICKFGI